MMRLVTSSEYVDIHLSIIPKRFFLLLRIVPKVVRNSKLITRNQDGFVIFAPHKTPGIRHSGCILAGLCALLLQSPLRNQYTVARTHGFLSAVEPAYL